MSVITVVLALPGDVASRWSWKQPCSGKILGWKYRSYRWTYPLRIGSSLDLLIFPWPWYEYVVLKWSGAKSSGNSLFTSWWYVLSCFLCASTDCPVHSKVKSLKNIKSETSRAYRSHTTFIPGYTRNQGPSISEQNKKKLWNDTINPHSNWQKKKLSSCSYRGCQGEIIIIVYK